jgi:hypothetical protein
MKTRLALLALLPLTASCSGGTSSESSGAAPGDLGTLAFEVTDAPVDPSIFQRAAITVDRIELHNQGEADSGFLVCYDGEPVQLDLTALRNGLTQRFPVDSLPPGTYRQARLRVHDALLVLKSGPSYSTRANTLRLTGQDTSGFKVFFEPPIEVQAGVETRVLLDFQLDRSYSPVPANDPENARFYHLHPVVRAALLQETGELRGSVTHLGEAGQPVPAAEAPVFVLDAGETDTGNALASTLTNEDGTFAILGLPAGTFDVCAEVDGQAVMQNGATITAEGVTDIEILVE